METALLSLLACFGVHGGSEMTKKIFLILVVKLITTNFTEGLD